MTEESEEEESEPTKSTDWGGGEGGGGRDRVLVFFSMKSLWQSVKRSQGEESLASGQ